MTDKKTSDRIMTNLQTKKEQMLQSYKEIFCRIKSMTPIAIKIAGVYKYGRDAKSMPVV